jgi:medium-chain acyl-[acyl-carrier-protein] hydrolase
MSQTNLDSTPWLLCPNPRPKAQLRLFCFPYAGAGASVFRPWAMAAPPEIEVYGVQLPGRESRFKEPLFTQIAPLIDPIITNLRARLDQPFAFFGHSVGALIGFEVTRRLQQRSLPMPQRLFVSARQAPQLLLPDQPLHCLSTANLKEKLLHYGGTPPAILQNDEWMELFLPILRADLALNETYRYTAAAPLNCPISAFGGLQDRQVSVDSVEAWAEQTTQSFNLRLLSGGHFFLKAETPAILQAIQEDARVPTGALP